MQQVSILVVFVLTQLFSVNHGLGKNTILWIESVYFSNDKVTNELFMSKTATTQTLLMLFVQ